jgi:hypothetical protein
VCSEAVPDGKLLHELVVAAATPPITVPITGDHMHSTELLNKNTPYEILRLYGSNLCIEGEAHQMVDAEGGEDLHPLVRRGKQPVAPHLLVEHLAWMGVEGHQHCRGIQIRCTLHHPVEDQPVTAVHAVERAHGDHAPENMSRYVGIVVNCHHRCVRGGGGGRCGIG